MTDSPEQRLRIKLLGNPSLMAKLKQLFERYDTDADPDKYAEQVVEVIVRESGLVKAIANGDSK